MSVPSPFPSASSDGTIIAWDALRHSVRTVLRGHSAWVDTLALSRDGRYLFSGGGDGKILMWDMEKGEVVVVVVVAMTIIITIGWGKSVLEQETETSVSFFHKLYLSMFSVVFSLFFSLSLSWTRARQRKFAEILVRSFEDDRACGCVKALALSPDCSTLFSAGASYTGFGSMSSSGPSSGPGVSTTPGVITIWDVADGSSLVHQMAYHTDAVSALAFFEYHDQAPGHDQQRPGQFVVSASLDCRVSLWNVSPVLQDMQRVIRHRVAQLGTAIDNLVCEMVAAEERLKVARRQVERVEQVCQECCEVCVLERVREVEDVAKVEMEMKMKMKTEDRPSPHRDLHRRRRRMRALQCLLCGTSIATSNSSNSHRRLSHRSRIADLHRDATAVVYQRQKALAEVWREIEATTQELKRTYESLVARQ